MICYKCFKSVPQALRTEHRECWRQYRLYAKRVDRTADLIKLQQLKNIRDRWGFKIHQNWLRIREYIIAPEKPEGLDNFLSEWMP